MRKPLLIRGAFFFLLLALSPFVLLAQTALQTLNNYLSQNASRLGVLPADYADLFVTSSYTEANTNIRHIYAQQRLNGIDVIGGMFALHANDAKTFDADNLLRTTGISIPSTAATIGAEQAVRKVLTEAHYSGSILLTLLQNSGNKLIFSRNDLPAYNIPVRKVYLPSAKEKKLRLAWEVQMWDGAQRHYWIMYVDAATGNVVRKVDAIIHCAYHNPHYRKDLPGEKADLSPFTIPAEQQFKRDNTRTFFTGIENTYRVVPQPFEALNKPGAAHVLTKNTGDPVASPDGWHKVGGVAAYNYARGNNVWAFQDPSPGPLGGIPSADPTRTAFANNGIGGTPPLVEPFVFDYPFDPAQDPTNSQKAAIVNLFYWNNLVHDVYYQFGFDENMNFQDSHLFSTGLRGPADANGQGDAVLAQAQDGGGTNNANFLTLPDGLPASAQMQMYLWTTSTPDQLVQITSSTGNPPAGTKYTAIQGSFSSLPTANNDLYANPVLNKPFVIIQKNALSTVGTSSEGCSTNQQSIALPPANDVMGKIVLIDRGDCSFAEKVLGAQLGGAAGAIIINNADGGPIAMGGTDAPANAIIIPAVMIGKADGEALKAAIQGGVSITGSLKKDTPPAARRDGDFDNGVISHEYGHGISNRLTGGGDALLPLGGDEQGGEGWSDFTALYMTMRSSDLVAASGYPHGKLPSKGIGTYVVYENTNGAGIRPSKYDPEKSQSPYSFKDIGKGGEISIPHGVGHIWCQMLYSMEQELINTYGFNDDVYNAATPAGGNVPSGAGGNNVANRLVVEGMKLQPVDPTFEQQRDAILKADTLLYNGQHGCSIWKAFAKWGLGYSAKSNTNGVGDEVEGYDVPAACDATQVKVLVKVSAPDTVTNGNNLTYTVKVRNPYPNPVSFASAGNKLPGNTSYQSSVPAGSVSSNTIMFPTTTLAANEEKTFTVTTKVLTPTSGMEFFFDNHEDGEGGWTKSSTTTDNWQIVSTRPYSGTKSWYAVDVDGVSNLSLQMQNPVTIPAGGAELVFQHFYASESGFDGGVVEISTNGLTWTYLPPQKFVRNGYSGIIPVANNPLIGTEDRFAFTGTSNGYVTSIASLADYAGQSIYVRFRMTSDLGTAVDGWYLDDVYIMAGRTEITNLSFARVSNSSGFTAPVATDSVAKTTFVFGGALSPLPAVFTELKAVPQANAIKLDWATLQEQDVKAFVVERQAQNEPRFTAIGEVQSTGNSSSRRSYGYADATAQRNLLYSYRVKLVNKDGSERYTNIASARLGESRFGFTVAPNPAASNIRLTFDNPPSSGALLRVYDVSGKRLATLNVGSLNSASTNINVASFGNGVYWLELEDNGLKQTQKLVIQR